MRKITLTVLVAICAVLPGRLDATPVFPTPNIQVSQTGSAFALFDYAETDLEEGEIDPKLAEIILKKASLKLDQSLSKLVDQFQKGDLVIEKHVLGYALVETKSGGITIAIIDEF